MAPRDVQPGDNVRRSREGQNSAQDFSGLRGTSDRPFHVTISGADPSFYDAFRQSGGAARPQQRQQADVSGAGFESLLTDARAIQSAGRDITRQLKLAADMASQFTRAMTLQEELRRRETESERQRVSDVLSRLENVLKVQDRPRGKRSSLPAVPPAASADDQAIDLDHPNADGTFPPAPPRGPGGPGGGGSGGGGGGGRGKPPRGGQPPAGPNDDRVRRPEETNLSYHRKHAVSRGAMVRDARAKFSEMVHQRYGAGIEQSPTIQPYFDEQNNVTHYVQHNPDGTQERVETNDPRAEKLGLRSSGQRIASAAAGGFARGGVGMAARSAVSAASSAGASGMLVGGLGLAAKAVPVVGWGISAVEGANSAAKWITEQRKINTQYQSIYGGSNLEAVPQRLQEQGFVWGQRFTGGMTEGDARQLFQGTSQLGIQGGERDNALSFASEQYKQLGMSVTQSMQAITLATNHANINLTGLSKGLSSVSLAARATNQNASDLRNTFLQNYAIAAQAGLGADASGLAAGMTNATQGVSRSLSGVNLSGFGNDTSLRVIANKNGLNGPGAVVAASNAGSPILSRAADQGSAQAATSVGKQAQAAVAQAIQAKGGKDKVAQSPAAIREIGQQAMAAGFDPKLYATLLKSATLGAVDLTGMDSSSITDYYISRQAGVTFEAAQAKAQGDQNAHQLAPTEMAAGGGGLTGGGLGLGGISQFVKDNASPFGLGFSGLTGDATGAYAKRQSTTHASDPAIEKLISAYGKQSDVGFEVETKDGKKTVSLADAIKYYPDQLAKGTATVVGGASSGGSVQSVVGFAQKDVNAADSTTGAAQGTTMTADEWKKKHPTTASDAQSQQTGKVVISPSQDLMRLFNFTPSGNAQVEGGAAAGVPPTIPGVPR